MPANLPSCRNSFQAAVLSVHLPSCPNLSCRIAFFQFSFLPTLHMHQILAYLVVAMESHMYVCIRIHCDGQAHRPT